MSGYRNRVAILGAFAALSATAVAVFAAPLIAGAAPAGPTLTIGAEDSPITYGDSTTVSGRLTDTKTKGGVTVTLQRLTFPYTGGWETRRTTSTKSDGSYKFGIAPTENSRFRVVASSPSVISDEVPVEVSMKVVLRLSDSTPHKRERIRFHGIVEPEHDGRTVYIQRKSHTGRWHSVKTTTLRDAGTAFSRFSKHYRIRRDGTFRALVFHDADHEDGRSRTKHANVVRGG
jgi:hypothetical protein